MAVNTTVDEKPNPLKTIIDTIVAPNDAFEAIRVVPTWGLALSIAIVVSAIAAFFITPAFTHAFAQGWPAAVAKSPQLSQLSAAQQQQQLNMTLAIMRFAWVFTILGIPFGALLQALVMTIVNAIGKGEGSFGKYWAAATNIAVPSSAIGGIVAAVIIMARGSDSFSTMQSVQTAVPSLALLAPGAGVKLLAFLGALTPFSIWGAILAGVAIATIGRVTRVYAWVTGAIVLFVPALLGLIFAR